jgi:hypothetical protein
VLPLIRFADATRAIIDTGIERAGIVEGTRVAALETFDSIYSWYGSRFPEFREAVRHLPFTFFPALPPPVEGVPRIPVPACAVEDFVAIQPFASSPTKRWPLDHFREVAAQLDSPVEWFAGPEEQLDCGRHVDDLYELACRLACARLYIGNDSGISHLAAAVGVPTLAIFLTTDPGVWAPRGGHVRVLRGPTVQDVVRAARSMLR